MYRSQSAKDNRQQDKRTTDSTQQDSRTTRQQDKSRVESRMLPSTDCINKTAEKYKQYAKHDENVQ